MVRWSALLSKIKFASAVCVCNVFEDVHGGPAVNCAVVRMEGGMLALHPPWSSSIINDLIMGGGMVQTLGIPTVK